MTLFEQELIRAIEHGCPECGYASSFSRSFHGIMWDKLLVRNNGIKCVDQNYQGRVKGAPERIYCPRCSKQVWDSDNGWISELQEVVKGE